MPNKILRDYSARSRLRFRIRIFILSGLLLLILVFLAYAIVYSPVFRINKIEIQGNSRVSQREINQDLYGQVLNSRYKYFMGFYNFLSWPDTISGSGLNFLPAVKEIEIAKNYFRHELTADVIERQPAGIWCFEKGDSPGCFWFDEEGVIFEKAFRTQGNLLIAADDYSQNAIPLGSKILPADFLANFFGIIQVLKNSGLNIKEIRLNDLSLEEIEADLNSGPKLYFSLRFSPLNDLSVINYLQQNQNFNKLQYIDFRSENRAFYK